MDLSELNRAHAGVVTLPIGAQQAPSRPLTLRQATGLASRVLILGTGDRALDVQNTLTDSDRSIDIIGFYATDVREAIRVPQARILPATASLVETARRERIDEIVVAVSDRRAGGLPLSDLLACKAAGIRVLDLASHFEQRLGQVRLDSVNPS
jgi:hypothetical protein